MHSQSLRKKDWCKTSTFSSSMCFSHLRQYITESDNNKINIILTLLASARDQKWHSVQNTFFPTIWHWQLPQTFFTLYPHFPKNAVHMGSSLLLSPFRCKQSLVCLPRLFFCLSNNAIPLWLAFYGCFWDFEQRNNSPPAHFLTNAESSVLRVCFLN